MACGKCKHFKEFNKKMGHCLYWSEEKNIGFSHSAVPYWSLKVDMKPHPVFKTHKACDTFEERAK